MDDTARDVAVSDARQQLAGIIDQVRAEHAPIYLTRRGQRVAAVIDAGDLERILELAEDMADIRAAEAARDEMRATGEAPVPWEQVKADLGATSYRVSLSPMAARQLRTLDAVARRRIQAALELLAEQPRPPASTQLVGGAGVWRVRTGDYRIVYEIKDDQLLVLVLRMGHRREVYKAR